jgi:hypothetical protein
MLIRDIYKFAVLNRDYQNWRSYRFGPRKLVLLQQIFIISVPAEELTASRDGKHVSILDLLHTGPEMD